MATPMTRSEFAAVINRELRAQGLCMRVDPEWDGSLPVPIISDIEVENRDNDKDTAGRRG